MERKDYAERLEALRTLMRSKAWDAVILTGSDPHCSEYPAARWKQVEWLSGFTGEAGDIVVTLDHAGLWTDTRYFIQAENQLARTGFVLHKTRVPEQVLIPEWLRLNLDSDSIIAVDGLCQSASAVASVADDFTVISVPNMLDRLWSERPAIPQTPVFTINGGESRAARLAWLRGFLRDRGCGGMLLSSLDEIAWILNVRASDIEFNPLVISYLLVTPDSADWFVLKDDAPDSVTEATFSILRSEGIHILPYSEAELSVAGWSSGKLFLDSRTVNYHFWSLADCDVDCSPSPVQMKKAIKNGFELEGIRRAQLNEGIVMETFLYWLEKSLEAGRQITERDASLKLIQLRSEMDGYKGDSFETISAYGSGAALPHYVTPRTNAPLILKGGLYLCDTGAQYEYGTTDITRTVPTGECSDLEKEDYTLVLKGHIDLAKAVFPSGTCGCHLDILARGPLWSHVRNFGHGTGHGVGFFLGVHEGPHEFRQNFNDVVFRPGMVVTDEPGIYRKDMHGVRHENMLACVEKCTNEFGSWLEFETLTLCHFDTSALLPQLLDGDELQWLNDYNEKVYLTLSPLLSPEVSEWLREKTGAIRS